MQDEKPRDQGRKTPRLRRTVTAGGETSRRPVLASLKRSQSAGEGLDLLAAGLGRQVVPCTEPQKLHSQIFIPADMYRRVPDSYRQVEFVVDDDGIFAPRLRCWAPRGMGAGDCWACNSQFKVNLSGPPRLSYTELEALRARAAQMSFDDHVRTTASALPSNLPAALRKFIAQQALCHPDQPETITP